MSWSASTKDAVNKASIAVDKPQLSDAVEVEQEAQFQAAVAAAKLLAVSVGRLGDEVMVTMSGHANPGHAPRVGWADEVITVSVSARPKKQED